MLQAARANDQLLDGIARDSREQASAIEEINSAMRQLDEMTQHNASLVEETNAAITQTESQAADLDRIVDLFAMDEQGAAPRRADAGGGVRQLQNQAKQVAKTYLGRGNAALKAGV
jgi:methyl-accepting chemotaxis protein